MNINNILNDENFIQDFFKFDTAPSRPVIVKWNGTGIHTIAGPTPFVDISKTFNTNEIGILESIVHTINLTGKIFPPGTGGVTSVVSGISKLEQLFKGCIRAPLEITCDDTIIFSASGVKVNNMSFNKTNDNWVQSADYTVDLEYKTGPTDDQDDRVENRAESWTIEPLDDAIYTKFSRSVRQKPEFFNPKLKPTPPSDGSPQPSQAVGGGQFGGGNGIQIFNIPQFRITRRLSAAGFSPTASNTDSCLTQQEMEAQRKTLFLKAKQWVDSQSPIPFNGASATGSVYFSTSPIDPNKKTWLYNHTRSTNFDIYNGTYEANDTWIAMPTGIPYTETFTVETSTDSSYNRTVTVAGTIQGLALSPTGITGNNYGPLSTNPSDPSNNSLVDLSYSLQESQKENIPNHKVLSISGEISSEIQDIKSAKYLNALDGWTKDIKPYLYRRACLAVNSDDRRNESSRNTSKPPSNPTYRDEFLLNVNPISTTEGHDPIKGTISYNHQFTNSLQLISGVMSENIQINNTAPANNIQEIPIIGRALGPIIFSAGSTNPKKSITIDIVVPKNPGIKATLQTDPQCPLYYNGFFWQTVNKIIEGNAPFSNRTNAFFDNASSQEFGTVFKDSDSESWNPTEGRYNRTVSWTYQQCTTNRFYLDH